MWHAPGTVISAKFAVTVTEEGGKASRLWVGEDNPFDQSLYVKKGAEPLVHRCAALTLEPVRTATAGDGSVELVVDDARSLLPELLQRVADAGVAVSSVEVQEPDLEAVFLHLTGKALRD